MREPEILRRGKDFHKRVQKDWKASAKDDHVDTEHAIALLPKGKYYQRGGRLDIFVDELGGFVSVVEIKSTDWDAVLETAI